MGLPVIVETNAWTLPQERFNAVWVTEKGVGISLSEFFQRRLWNHAQDAADPIQHATMFAERVRRLKNRAVFEIPEILDRILTRQDE